MAAVPGSPRFPPLSLVLCLLPGWLSPSRGAAGGSCAGAGCPSAVTVTVASPQRCGPAVPPVPGPAWRAAAPGAAVTLACSLAAPAGARVTWHRACARRANGTCGDEDGDGDTAAPGGTARLLPRPGGAALAWDAVTPQDTGLYYCRVGARRSCGTFLHVREAAVPFLNVAEATKDRVMAAQGALLLLCAAGPGLLLLLRKRRANERLLQGKRPPGEEENLYEGLRLDECSMYEDIGRGPPPTYQDVGPRAGDGDAGQLEKP